MAKAETGPCTAFFRLWTYNFKKGQCEQFIYGGCHGTENQYRTKEKCERACKLPTARSLACYLPLLEGTAGCSAPDQRFYFNTTSERCEQFLFKGCVGNTNNFLRLEDCQRKCYGAAYPEFGKDTDAVELPQLRVWPAWYCSLPAKAGPCEAAIPRVFFNVNSEACEDFVYGGCEGNRNNFNNHAQCQAACYSRRMVLARP
ncbi:tissue factor pathway inhibitor-like [Dermacentor silvarum]|uniref:tissue factor pathway inhibitor-like n=1 Tax=Dermacentor silvarum TaxID=543639 RepID=UPI0021009E83|nr:tissue factor pathway inhibitor-like [Dermacentor silvarum]